MRDMTLDEMEASDIENLEYVMGKSKEHSFANPIVADMFCKESLTAILKRCGVRCSAQANPRFVDKQLEDNGVKVERRKYDGEDTWRSCLYVYKGNEIAGFVSLPSRTKLGFFKVRSTENP
jgi:hypothetical protein